MTEIAKRILKFYEQVNVRADEMLLPESLINVIGAEQSEIQEGIAELGKLGYLLESDDRLFLTKKGFDYIAKMIP